MISIETIFRGALLFSIAGSFVLIALIPVDPQLEAEMNAGYHDTLFVFSLVFIFLSFFNTYQLYTFKPSGRKVLVFLLITGFIVSVFAPQHYVPYSSLYLAVQNFFGIFAGFILAMTFFAEGIKEKFD
tara:strand:- start:66 stop:449 length:384 start_codon:yes stop_codon:yes gene_type:complete